MGFTGEKENINEEYSSGVSDRHPSSDPFESKKEHVTHTPEKALGLGIVDPYVCLCELLPSCDSSRLMTFQPCAPEPDLWLGEFPS